jgi:hypothetical protein
MVIHALYFGNPQSNFYKLNSVSRQKGRGSGEGIFARHLVTTKEVFAKLKNLLDKTYKFFFLQEWIILGNTVEIV